MEPISIRTLAASLGLDCADDARISHISTDSRQITPGCVFVCIEGERFDGHAFAAQSIERGAAYIVARAPVPVDSARVFYVPNTLDANIALAGAYRRMFSPRTVGITGSVGKTTTKEFIAAVAAQKYRTLKTEGNLNNEIGVPATLLRLDHAYEAMVIEMGMNGVGDIDKLSHAVLPDVAVLTNIGTSHIELLGSRENILKTKLEILLHLKPGAPLILCADNDLLAPLRPHGVRSIRYGIDAQDVDVRAGEIVPDGEGLAFTIECAQGRFRARIPVIGRHNVYNALAAFAAGRALDIPPAEILLGLAAYEPSGMRQRITRRAGVAVVEDCYNASPDSMRAALAALRELPTEGKRIAVLGDMLELGQTSEEAHQAIGSACAGGGIDRVFCLGERARDIVRGARAAGMGKAEHYSSKEALAAALAQSARGGDTVWFKASRGMRFEEIIEPFVRALDAREPEELQA